jgi:transcriptional regulator GlxA family with amidase domain
MVIGKRFARKEKIVTKEGVSAGIDGSLYLLGKMFNKEVLKDAATHVMYNGKPETLGFIIK